jgi:quercetin dioxygenase-like cupin family protein
LSSEPKQHKWGLEIHWANTKQYSGRFFVIREGEATDFGFHRKQDTTVFVLQGLVQLTLETQTKLLQEGESYHFHPGIMHQLTAIKGDATILECGTEATSDFVAVKR